MMPIMMELTTSEMDTNAMSTVEIMFTMSVTELMSEPATSEYWIFWPSCPLAAFERLSSSITLSSDSLAAKSLG